MTHLSCFLLDWEAGAWVGPGSAQCFRLKVVADWRNEYFNQIKTQGKYLVLVSQYIVDNLSPFSLKTFYSSEFFTHLDQWISTGSNIVFFSWRYLAIPGDISHSCCKLGEVGWCYWPPPPSPSLHIPPPPHTHTAKCYLLPVSAVLVTLTKRGLPLSSSGSGNLNSETLC